MWYPLLASSPDIGQMSDRCISNFQISGQYFWDKSCRTSHDIDIKLGPVTKLGKRSLVMAKKIDSDRISKKCSTVTFFLIYVHFAAIRKPNSRCMIYKLIFSLTIAFYLAKPEKRTKILFTQLYYYCFE